MAYLGLVPSESSSGEHSQRGPPTRTGNTHARRLLIEAAHNQRRRPARSAHLARRQAGQPAHVVAHAQRAQLRLHRRWQRMSARGKHSNKIAAAVARELAGTSRRSRARSRGGPSTRSCGPWSVASAACAASTR